MNRDAADRFCRAHFLVKSWWRLGSWLRPLVLVVVVLTACSPVDLTRFSDAVLSVADRGIGGTGIFGTITGFGSVLVNGLTIDFDQETVITNDGVLTSESALAVGQVVAIEAGSREGRLQARSISIANAVSGPITAVTASRTQIEVLGQTVALDPEMLKTPVPTDLSAGQWVTVSGLRNAQGTIVASRIGRRATGGRISVRGPVRSRTENGFTIGRLSVIAPGPGPGRTIERGLTTLVVGALTSAGLRAAQVQVASIVPFDGHLSRLSIEGFVGRREGQRVSISGIQASITDATEVRGKADNQLSANDRVTIDAVIEGGETLATKIDVHAPATHDTRESRGDGIRERAARSRERSDELSEHAGE